MEAQQEEAVADGGQKVGQLTAEQRAARKQREALTLMHKKVEHDLAAATNPRHRQMLEQALADLEGKLREIKED